MKNKQLTFNDLKVGDIFCLCADTETTFVKVSNIPKNTPCTLLCEQYPNTVNLVRGSYCCIKQEAKVTLIKRRKDPKWVTSREELNKIEYDRLPTEKKEKLQKYGVTRDTYKNTYK